MNFLNSKKILPRLFWIGILTIVIALFFWQTVILGKLPIPADTIVGLYHPWRDEIWNNFTSGVPFKNFLVTDPVRQQYPWRELGIQLLKRTNLPLWNPYIFSGTPLLANLQSSLLYPLNLVFFLLPFNTAWSLLVILQSILSGLFTYLYLRNLRLTIYSGLLGAIIFAFCGFSIAWLEWNTIGHVGLWLPLILLSIDKISRYKLFEKSNIKIQILTYILWSGVFVFGLSSALFAGHLQTYFYVLLFSLIYTIVRVYQLKTNGKLLLLFILCFLIHFIVTSIQWLPTLQFIALSARAVDPNVWQRSDWFLPWQNLVQFIAPDFFGNPTTLNYWGIWNYGEFVGYVGLLPLALAIFSILFKRNSNVVLFGVVGLAALLFALPTPLAKIPYVLHIPLISTSQPSRLLFVVDFGLACLAALGFDTLITSTHAKKELGKLISILVGIGTVLGLMMLTNIYLMKLKQPFWEQWTVTFHNLIFPLTLVILICTVLLGFFQFAKVFRPSLFIYLILAITLFDLFRFGWKFTPFTNKNWLFPQIKTTGFLKKQSGIFRIMSLDSRIFPPNFSVAYHLQTVEGYDPLYLGSYGDFVASWVRKSYDDSPANFNRIITPQDYTGQFADLTNIRYVLSLKDEQSSKLRLVFKEGQTRVYENTQVFPRAFLVEKVTYLPSQQSRLTFLVDNNNNLRIIAVVEEPIAIPETKLALGERVDITSYSENEIVLNSHTTTERFMVLTDVYYPTWEVYIDSNKSKIYRTDYTFRGIIIPSGNHQIRFTINRLI